MTYGRWAGRFFNFKCGAFVFHYKVTFDEDRPEALTLDLNEVHLNGKLLCIDAPENDVIDFEKVCLLALKAYEVAKVNHT